MGPRKIKIIWTEPAISDLKEIHAFLAQRSLKAAYKVIEQILSKVIILEDGFVNSRQKEPLLKASKYDYRYLIQDHYKIIYRAYPDKAEIAAVFDTRQNPEKLPDIM